MGFPQVSHCIVCEGVRPEFGSKSTILGFLGIAPHVELRVMDLQKPIDSLCFVLFCEPGQGQFRVLPQLLDSGEHVLLSLGSDQLVTLTNPKLRPVLVFGFSQIKFPGAGTFAFALKIDGKEHYRTPFGVAQARPQDFQVAFPSS